MFVNQQNYREARNQQIVENCIKKKLLTQKNASKHSEVVIFYVTISNNCGPTIIFQQLFYFLKLRYFPIVRLLEIMYENSFFSFLLAFTTLPILFSIQFPIGCSLKFPVILLVNKLIFQIRFATKYMGRITPVFSSLLSSWYVECC